jgi:two-component system response regulator AlgR
MDAPLRIFIVDDEAPARSRLRALLADSATKLPSQVVGEAASGFDAFEQLAAAVCDVALLDIQMPGMDGLSLARHLGQLANSPAIVFVTAHDEHAIQAFELGAIDYLLKPVHPDRLVAALKRARRFSRQDQATLAKLTPPSRHFSICERDRVRLVPSEEALYLRAELKYVTLRTREHEYLLDQPLTTLEQEFATDFLRIHRNCLVNKRHLQGFQIQRGAGEQGWVALLRDWPERLPVSRRHNHVVREFREVMSWE